MAVYGRVWLLWPCIAVYSRILQYIAVYCSISQYIAVYCSISQYIEVYRSILLYIAVYCSTLQYIAFSRGHRSKFIWSCWFCLDLGFSLFLFVPFLGLLRFLFQVLILVLILIVVSTQVLV